MARLKFDLKPVRHYAMDNPERLAEHNEWVRSVYAQHHPGETPTPCDCGYWEPHAELLTLCPPNDRERCRRDATKRLENHAREEHKRALRQKRVFPEIEGWRGAGSCRWCLADVIIDGKLAKRRHWHPKCLGAYNLHTFHESQRAFLDDRQGHRCAGCNALCGKWGWRHEVDPDKLRAGDPTFHWAKRYPVEKYVGIFTATFWACTFEVDHTIPLAAVFEAFTDPARRRWFFGPPNLQGLCRECHRVKTRADIAFIKACQRNGAEWARAEIINMLAERGLLKGAPNV